MARTIDREQLKAKLDREIIVYCGSCACQASPKAADKLERLGFRNVWDYAGGKADWVEAGYPLEREQGAGT